MENDKRVAVKVIVDEELREVIRELVKVELAKERELERRSRGWKPFSSQPLPGPKEVK